MIKVIDKETNTAVSIEVCGNPYQWRLRLGKEGTRTPKKGKNKGVPVHGIFYGRETYHGNLREVLQEVQQRISLDRGLPPESQNIEGMKGWEAAIAEEQKLVSVVVTVHKGFSDFLIRYGAQLKEMASLDTDADDDEPEEEEVAIQ